jgi:hypothetical protein
MYNGNQTVQTIAQGLGALTPNELAELDAIITPRAAVLMAKAFGPEIGELLGPLTRNDAPDGTAAGLDALEGPNGDAPVSAAEEQLREMMRDPRYWRDRDPQLIDRVSCGFQRLYPGQNGSSL